MLTFDVFIELKDKEMFFKYSILIQIVVKYLQAPSEIFLIVTSCWFLSVLKFNYNHIEIGLHVASFQEFELHA